MNVKYISQSKQLAMFSETPNDVRFLDALADGMRKDGINITHKKGEDVRFMSILQIKVATLQLR